METVQIESDREFDRIVAKYWNAHPESDPLLLLVALACECIDWIRHVAEIRPELLRPLAKEMIAWPDFIGRHPGAKKRNEWLLKQLRIGTETLGGRWGEGTRAGQQAAVLLAWLQTNQAALELHALAQETREQWFSLGWTHLLTATNGKPEEDEFLAPIGQYRAKHSERIGQQKRVTKGASAANVRNGIHDKLWQSFKTQTKNAPASP